jgi:hypothetical protein
VADYTYATDHVNFLLKKEKFEAAKQSLRAYAIKERKDATEHETLEAALAVFDWEPLLSEEGDIVDMMPADSVIKEEEIWALLKGIGEFVEPGSYISFVFGGAGGCWALAWDTDPATNKVVGYETDVETVLVGDLKAMLAVVQFSDVELYEQMKAKYVLDEPEGEDGPEREP